MKKFFIYFLLLSFPFSLLYAQDTIVLRTHQRIPCKVISVTDQVFYSTPDYVQLSVKTSDIDYIRYKDGSTYTAKHDSAIKPTFYIQALVGVAIPAFNSYGNENDNTGARFAQPGAAFGATFGANLYHGWGVALSYSHISLKCDASEFLSEQNGLFAGIINFGNTVTSTGNYTFTHSVYLLELTKTMDYKFGDIGLSLMFGDFNTSIPNMQGVADNVWNVFLGYPSTYYIYTSYNTQNNFALGFKIYGDIKIAGGLFLHTELSMLFSKITNDGYYSYGYIPAGTIFATGQYGNSTLSTADLASLSVGIKYLF